MSEVALLMLGNPYAPNGAAGYMRRLYDNRELAFNAGIDSVEFCHGGANFTDVEVYSASFASKAKDKVKTLLWKTRLGTTLGLKLVNGPRADNALRMYSQLSTQPDAVIFNDTFIHDAFVERFPDYPGLRVQILHNNGEFGKMLFIAFPKISSELVASMETRTFVDSDVIVFVGAKNKERFDSLHPECVGKSAHVHLGIDDLGANPAYEGGGPFTFVTVGTVCARKNQRVLLEVAKDVDIRSRCRFVVVGGGDELEPCRAEAEKLGLSDVVRFVGPSSHVVDWYRQADGFISVSLDEGLPTVALEAMSCGLPLVLTDVGGCAELIDGNGVLVPTCDTSAIIDGIHKFFALYDAGCISCAASREMFDAHYTTEVMWQEWAELIKERLAAKGANTRG